MEEGHVRALLLLLMKGFADACCHLRYPVFRNSPLPFLTLILMILSFISCHLLFVFSLQYLVALLSLRYNPLVIPIHESRVVAGTAASFLSCAFLIRGMIKEKFGHVVC